MTAADPFDRLCAAAEAVVAAVTYDDSGLDGRGGNGGLLSRETTRKVDELRLALFAVAAAPRRD